MAKRHSGVKLPEKRKRGIEEKFEKEKIKKFNKNKSKGQTVEKSENVKEILKKPKSLETGTFVMGIPYDITKEMLKDSISKHFGAVESAYICKNEFGDSKGVAFVYFKKKEDAMKAIDITEKSKAKLEVLSNRQKKKKQQKLEETEDSYVEECLIMNGKRLQFLKPFSADKPLKQEKAPQQDKKGSKYAFTGLYEIDSAEYKQLSEQEQRLTRLAYQETRIKLKKSQLFR